MERFVNSPIAESGEYWWNLKRPEQPSLWDSKIELSEKFFNEIIRNPVPLDMNTLTALKRCSLGLDLYLWLVYRTFALRTPQRLTWRQLYHQFGPTPNNAATHDAVQNFRRRILRELKKIKLAWKDLTVSEFQSSDVFSETALFVTARVSRNSLLRPWPSARSAYLNYSTAPGVLILHPSTPTIPPVESSPRLAR